MSGQPPSSPVQAGAPRVPTAQESNFLVAIVKNSDGVTNIDWDAVATEAGYNNAATARVRFGQVKRALGWTVRCVGSKTSPTKGGGSGPSPTKVEKKPAAAKRVRKSKAMKKHEEALREALLARVADEESGGDEADGTDGVKEENGDGYKDEKEVIVKVEEGDEGGDTPAEEEEYASADDFV